MIADFIVIARWTDHGVGLTGWGVFILAMTVWWLTDIGNKRR